MAKVTPDRPKEDYFDRTQWLATEILRHKRLYYKGKPEISDLDYDRLENELKVLRPNHPVLQMVGADEGTSSNPKVLHKDPMLSLDKTYDVNDLKSWANGQEIVGTLKVDGTSLSIVYANGQLQLGKTRGNGREGEDVTAKIRWVSDIPSRLEDGSSVEIRGELFCSESNFAKLAGEMLALGLDRPTSPRNIVAGVLGRKNFASLAGYFSFFAFDVIGLNHFKTEIEKSDWLRNFSFRLPDPRLLKTNEDIDEYLVGVCQRMEEDEVGCDGAVFCYNDLRLHEELGVTSHHPRFKMSFKWQGATARSTIVRMDWATSRFGVVTPVAVIDPVSLSGATITNITLHNAAHVKAYNLKVGDTIELVRSGEVIPKFLSVIQSAQGSCVIPEQCPSCASVLEFDDVRVKCPNRLHCPAQWFGGILNWIHAVNIEDLSEKRLQQMIDQGLVRGIPDLYHLTTEQLQSLPATREKMAQKLWSNIQKSKNLPLAVFLNGLGIEGAGQTTWEKLIDVFADLDGIRRVSVEEVASVNGFAERSAHQIVLGLKDCSSLIDTLLTLGVKPIVEQVERTNTLKGMMFVITGALSQPRKEIESLIKRAGGSVGSSVTKNTSVLIANEVDSSSSKMVKAKELGVEVWSEEKLIKFLK